MSGFDDWLKRYRVFSRVLLSLSFYLMYWVTVWGTQFATSSKLSGTEIAAVLAAVQIPATALFGAVFKTYSENKIP